jgi:GNAT superfamily N-acetyltransferase
VKEEAQILGFAHFAVAEPARERREPYGIIRFLWYEPGHREAGQQLLAEAEERLLEQDPPKIAAFDQEHRYPFYHLKHAYLSFRMGHVQALLGMNGFLRSRGEIFMDRTEFQPIPPNPVGLRVSTSVERPQGRGRLPGVLIRATFGKQVVGTCESISCGEFSSSDGAQDWIFTTGLNVDEEYQGRGLGKHLLRRALQEAHELGYRGASISTDWNNHRAYLFYTNFGYHVVDWTFEFLKELAQ